MVDQTYNYIVLGILIALVASIFVFLGYYLYKEESKFKKIINNQAIKRNGNVTGGFIFGNKTLKFEHGGSKVKLYTVKGGRFDTSTYLEIKLSNILNQQFNIHKKTQFSKIGKTLGMKDIEIGHDDFDNEVVVKGSDEKFMRQILIYKIREKTRNLVKKYTLSINFNKDVLVISFQDIIKNEDDCNELIDFSLKLVDKIKNPDGL